MTHWSEVMLIIVIFSSGSICVLQSVQPSAYHNVISFLNWHSSFPSFHFTSMRKIEICIGTLQSGTTAKAQGTTTIAMGAVGYYFEACVDNNIHRLSLDRGFLFKYLTLSRVQGQFSLSCYKQKTLLNNFMLGRNEQDTSHRLYM